MIAGLFRRWRSIRYPHPIVDPETQRLSAGAPRPLTEVARIAAAAVRRYGWRGTFDRLRQVGAGPDPQIDYATWCQRHTPDAPALAAMAEQAAHFPYQPLISIITPVWNTDPRWLHALTESVRQQVYPRWELCLADDASEAEATRTALRELAADPRITISRLPANGHISAASNAALATASGEFVVMLDHDDELTPDALFEVVRHLNQHPDADMLYSDEDKLDLEGRRCDPYFKPDWSPEHFFSCMYTCHLMAVRRRLVEEIGGFRLGYEGAQDYDLVLRVMERTTRIHHIPKILYRWRKLPESAASAIDAKPWAHEAAHRALADHFRRTGERAEVLPGATQGSFRIRFQIAESPLVSIIIPARAAARGNAARILPPESREHGIPAVRDRRRLGYARPARLGPATADRRSGPLAAAPVSRTIQPSRADCQRRGGRAGARTWCCSATASRRSTKIGSRRCWNTRRSRGSEQWVRSCSTPMAGFSTSVSSSEFAEWRHRHSISTPAHRSGTQRRRSAFETILPSARPV